MQIAVYAGSFDPPTNGHLWMIRRGAKLFDKLIVGVGINPDKSYTFSENQRIDMLEKLCRHIPGNIEIVSYKNSLLIHFAQKVKAQWILRGMRNEKDFLEEKDMRDEHGATDRTIETVFMFTPLELRRVSSNFVKGLTKYDRWEELAKDHLPPLVYEEFLRRFSK